MIIKRVINKIFRIISSFLVSTRAFFRLLVEKKTNTSIFITSYAIGDVVYALAYLEEYKKQHPEQRIIVIASPKISFLLDSYESIDEVQYFNRTEKYGYEYLVVLNGSSFYSFLGKFFHIYNTLPYKIYGYGKKKDCLSLLRQYLNIDTNALPAYPLCRGQKGVAIKDFEERRDRVVIINPFMHNHNESELGSDFGDIIALLNRNGYVVYTNVIGEQKALLGTYPLNCSLEEFLFYANHIPLIISARSGIMDLLINTSAVKIIVYPKSVSEGWIEMFSMSYWGKDNIFEVFNSDFTKVCEDVVSTLELTE